MSDPAVPLRAELRWLREYEGLTRERLARSETLSGYLEPHTLASEEPRAALIWLLDELGTGRYPRALRSALNIGETCAEVLMDRRDDFAELIQGETHRATPHHLDTVRNWENKAIEELIQLLLAPATRRGGDEVEEPTPASQHWSSSPGDPDLDQIEPTWWLEHLMILFDFEAADKTERALEALWTVAHLIEQRQAYVYIPLGGLSNDPDMRTDAMLLVIRSSESEAVSKGFLRRTLFLPNWNSREHSTVQLILDQSRGSYARFADLLEAHPKGTELIERWSDWLTQCDCRTQDDGTATKCNRHGAVANLDDLTRQYSEPPVNQSLP